MLALKEKDQIHDFNDEIYNLKIKPQLLDMQRTMLDIW
jgi:hypothetical protein